MTLTDLDSLYKMHFSRLFVFSNSSWKSDKCFIPESNISSTSSHGKPISWDKLVRIRILLGFCNPVRSTKWSLIFYRCIELSTTQHDRRRREKKDDVHTSWILFAPDCTLSQSHYMLNQMKQVNSLWAWEFSDNFTKFKAYHLETLRYL